MNSIRYVLTPLACLEIVGVDTFSSNRYLLMVPTKSELLPKTTK